MLICCNDDTGMFKEDSNPETATVVAELLEERHQLRYYSLMLGFII